MYRSVRLTPWVSAAMGILLTSASPVFGGQTPAPPATTAVAPSSVPLPNRLNQALPPWIRLRAEFRARMEGVDNAGFVDDRDDLFWLGRLRVNATVTPARHLSFQVQVQDARVARKQIGAIAPPFRAPLDVRTAFAELGAATGRVTARVGRQELAFGEQRLVGHASWLNAARTFDAGRVTLRPHKKLQMDVFAASVVRILPSELDKSGNGNRFVGAYASTSALTKQVIEPYLFWRTDSGVRTESGTTGRLRQSTTGVRWVATLPTKFEFGMESAVERGSVGPDSIHAWAGHVQLKSPVFGPALRMTSDYNYASGDADATDGVRGTFDQLYPTSHEKYGLADQVGWRNIHHVRIGFDVARLKGWPITANYHTWWLADAHDGLYLAGGALLARVPGGAAHRHVGQELDLQVSHALTPQLQLSAGYASIAPGRFLKQATPGASYSTPFAMLTYVFLAEK